MHRTTNSHCPSEVRPLSASCTPYVQQTTPQSTGGKLHPQSSLKSRSRNPSTAGRPPNQNSSNSGNSGGSSGPKSLGANTSSPSNTSVLYNYNNTSITITNPECLENGSASYMTAASYHVSPNYLTFRLRTLWCQIVHMGGIKTSGGRFEKPRPK